MSDTEEQPQATLPCVLQTLDTATLRRYIAKKQQEALVREYNLLSSNTNKRRKQQDPNDDTALEEGQQALVNANKAETSIDPAHWAQLTPVAALPTDLRMPSNRITRTLLEDSLPTLGIIDAESLNSLTEIQLRALAEKVWNNLDTAPDHARTIKLRSKDEERWASELQQNFLDKIKAGNTAQSAIPPFGATASTSASAPAVTSEAA